MAEVIEQKVAVPSGDLGDVFSKAMADIKKEKEANKPVVDPPKEEVKVDPPKEIPAAEVPKEVPKEEIKETPKAEVVDNKPKPTNNESSKEWYEEESHQEKPSAEKGNEQKSKELLAKAQEYDSLLKDPKIEAILSAKKAGKSILSVMEEIKGEDYDKYTPEQLFEKKLKNLGAEADDITEAMEKFKDKPKWERLDLVTELREKFKSEQNQKLKKFSESQKSNVERQRVIAEKAVSELDKFSSEIIDKEFLGLKVTPEIVDSIKDRISNKGLPLQREDGSWNVPILFEFALFLDHKKTLMKANVDRARSKGKEEILKEITRPSKNETEVRVPTENAQSKEEKAITGFMSNFTPAK